VHELLKQLPVARSHFYHDRDSAVAQDVQNVLRRLEKAADVMSETSEAIRHVLRSMAAGR
jgi:hypothetical protein